MKARGLLVAGLAAALLALPAAAGAKGASGATVQGQGLAGPVTLRGDGESGSGTRLGSLADGAGFFPAAYGQEPDPMLPGRPAGDLGPRYVITWVVPGPDGRNDLVRQDAYPFPAKGGPFTYMRPGQRFMGGETTRGGWYPADEVLRSVLVALGVPRTRPASTAAPATTSAGPKPAVASPAQQPAAAKAKATVAGVPGGAVVALVALALAGAAALGLRRRSRRSP